MTRRGLAIVGLGMALKPHAKALNELQDLYEVVGAYSRSEERRNAAEQQFGLHTTSDLDALIADPRISTALILTPPDSHMEISKRFLEAGKHVLVEKPIETTSARGAELVSFADTRNLRLGVVLQHRFRESSRVLLDLLASGQLGRLSAANCTVPWWRNQMYYDEPGRGTLARDGGGVLMTQAIHAIDLFRILVGGVNRVAAAAVTTSLHRMEREDYVAAVLQCANGAVGNLMATTAAYPGHSDGIELICENGIARLHGGALAVHWLTGEVTEVATERPLGAGGDPMDFPSDAHRELLRDFSMAIDEQRDSLASGREALQTQLLIDALIRSSEQRAWEDVSNA